MFLAVALPVLATLIGSLATVDLTYLIRAGEEIFATGRIPNVDTWTFTAAGLPWVDQQWGTEVIFATVYRLGGWTGYYGKPGPKVMRRGLDDFQRIKFGATLRLQDV